MRILSDSQAVTFSVPDTEEYPLPAAGDFEEKVVLTKEVFTQLHRQILYASKDVLRPALTGISIGQDKTLSSVATDGHVLQWITDLDPDGKCQLKRKFACVVPAGVIAMVSSSNRGDVSVSLSEDKIRFTFNNRISVTASLIRENYPDFRNVIPKPNGNQIRFSRKELLKAIKSARRFADRMSNRAVLESENGQVKIQVENADEKIRYESTLSILDKKGNELKMALNLELLERTVKGQNDQELVWNYGTPDDPAVFTSDGPVKNLLMPVRL